MTEKFEMTGEWYLPNSAIKRAHGTLTYDPQDGLKLGLYGSLEDFPLFQTLSNYEVILGLTSNSKQVTLYGCYMVGSSTSIVMSQESGLPSSNYNIRFCLIGLHVQSESELVFNKLSAEIFNLGEWIGISGFQRRNIEKDLIKSDRIEVKYRQPKPIHFEIDDNTKGVFKFISNCSNSSRYQKSVTINQKVEFQVISDVKLTINDFLNYLGTFQDFLTLALYKSTYPLTITLSGENHKTTLNDNIVINKSINLYFSFKNYKPNEIPKHNFKMIFTYKDISRTFNTLIKNWYSKYNLLEPAFNLVFTQFHNQNQSSINTFLNLAQAAETFHARLYDRERMPREKYRKMKREILELVPNKYHYWLNEQFNFGNNLNLHSRLTELTSKYSNSTLDALLGDTTLFIKNVKDSRNYYTHYSERGKNKALKGANLYYLTERLKILLVYSFLIETGIKKKKLSLLLENASRILFNHL